MLDSCPLEVIFALQKLQTCAQGLEWHREAVHIFPVYTTGVGTFQFLVLPRLVFIVSG